MVTVSSIHVDIKRSFLDVPLSGPSAPRAALAQLSISTQFDVSISTQFDVSISTQFDVSISSADSAHSST